MNSEDYFRRLDQRQDRQSGRSPLCWGCRRPISGKGTPRGELGGEYCDHCVSMIQKESESKS